ncbi:MAG: hypothetical protein R3E95_07560 [Thiolinea sp.]
MKIYRYGAGMLWLCCLLSFPAAAQVLLERDGQALMQADVDNMLAAGEQLAGAAFSADERTQLQAWALQLFEQDADLPAVQRAFAQYQDFLQQLSQSEQPGQQALLRRDFYQRMVFHWRFPRYPQADLTLLDVITRHNPLRASHPGQQRILTQHMLQDWWQTRHYFAAELGLLVAEDVAEQQAAEQQQIAAFNAQPDATVFGEHAYWLRSRLFWQQLPEEEQTALAEAMRTAYQDSGDVQLALQPLFAQLDVVVRLENQQKQWQQQQMGALLLQQLQVNQQIFDQALQSYRESGDAVARNIRDQSVRSSVAISGGRVLETHPDHFVVESRNGARYTLSR